MGCFSANLINLENADILFTALLIIKVTFCIWMKYVQNTGIAKLLGFCNYYFNVLFCGFNHLDPRSVFHYAMLY